LYQLEDNNSGLSLQNILAVAEASPLVKVSGLGDVAGPLPLALRQREHDARIIMPCYVNTNLEGYEYNKCSRFIMPFLNNHKSIVINEVLSRDDTAV
jgi:glycogen synthase